MPYSHPAQISPAIVALAGRRIDAPYAKEVHFPLVEVEHVAKKLLYRFKQEQVTRIVCSAACGADILALEAAERLAIPATIVLPFVPRIFRTISVTDRPGSWGERFDRLVAAARKRDDLVELNLEKSDDNAFTAANDRILQIAGAFPYKKLAFVIWEGRSRGHGDATKDFLNKAMVLNFEKRAILTIRRAH